jgi:lipopolysaccharide export system ATP-binding protein
MGQLLARGLVKRFGGRLVVNDVTIVIHQGEVVGLVGRNGAGKSTTFQMIAGYVVPDAGAILLDDVEMSRRPPYQRARLGLTYLPQERSVFLKLSARENVLVPLEERGVPARDRAARADALLEEFGLGQSACLPAHALSGGESRKLEVARALATDPKYVLFDEPFAGIDPINVAELQQAIRALQSRGIGVLVADHNVFYAFEIIDRGYVIDAGRVLVEGSPLALGTDPRAREAFLGEEFRLPPVLARHVEGRAP